MPEKPTYPYQASFKKRGEYYFMLSELQRAPIKLDRLPALLPLDHPNYQYYMIIQQAIKKAKITPNDAFFISSLLLRETKWANMTDIKYASNDYMDFPTQTLAMFRANKLIGAIIPEHKIYTIGRLGKKRRAFLELFSPRLLDLYDNKMLITREGMLPDELADIQSLRILPDPSDNRKFLKAMSQITWFRQKNEEPTDTGIFYLSITERILLHLIYLKSPTTTRDQLANALSQVLTSRPNNVTVDMLRVNLSRLRTKLRTHPKLVLPDWLNR